MEYQVNIAKIEDLKDNLKISENKLSDIMNKDVYNSNHIEGNSLTAKEVTYLLENNVTVRGKPLKDHIAIKNYDLALKSLKSVVKENAFRPTIESICQLHHIITKGELPNDECGALRNDAVFLRTTSYIPPHESEIHAFLQEAIEEYDNPSCYKSDFERICELKRNFERIHPFFDGNGRTGRVLANTLFLQSGYGYISVPPEEREEYFESIENNTMHEYFAKKMIESMEHIKEFHHSNTVTKTGETIDTDVQNREESDYNF